MLGHRSAVRGAGTLVLRCAGEGLPRQPDGTGGAAVPGTRRRAGTGTRSRSCATTTSSKTSRASAPKVSGTSIAAEDASPPPATEG